MSASTGAWRHSSYYSSRFFQTPKTYYNYYVYCRHINRRRWRVTWCNGSQRWYFTFMSGQFHRGDLVNWTSDGPLWTTGGVASRRRWSNCSVTSNVTWWSKLPTMTDDEIPSHVSAITTNSNRFLWGFSTSWRNQDAFLHRSCPQWMSNVHYVNRYCSMFCGTRSCECSDLFHVNASEG